MRQLSHETDVQKTTQKLLLTRALFQILTSPVFARSSFSAAHREGSRKYSVTDGLTASGQQPLHIAQPLSVINGFPIVSKTLWQD